MATQEVVLRHLRRNLETMHDPEQEMKERIFCAVAIWYSLHHNWKYIKTKKEMIREICEKTNDVLVESKGKRKNESHSMLLDECKEILKEIQPPFNP